MAQVPSHTSMPSSTGRLYMLTRTIMLMQAMGWAGMFVASAGTGLIGVVLCALLGVLYTLGFIVASAGEDGHSGMMRSLHAMARWLSNNW